MEKCDTSCEPMDVDLSSHSANISCVQDVSFTEPPVASTIQNHTTIESEVIDNAVHKSHTATSNSELWHVNKFHINMKTEKKKKTYLKLFVIPLIVLCISLYFALEIKCSDELDLIKLETKLTKRLYGQSKVVKNLIEALEININSKIIFFYGGTGVGKTFTSSLMLENSWNTSNIYHYTMPSFVDVFSTDTMLGMNLCKSSIVLVDDLSQNDFKIKKIIADVLEKSEHLNKKITIILIYTCDIIATNLDKGCDDSFPVKLDAFYRDINVYKKIIRFEPLTNEILKKCVEYELGGREISEADFESILLNFDVKLDGCKGVHKKINILNY